MRKITKFTLIQGLLQARRHGGAEAWLASCYDEGPNKVVWTLCFAPSIVIFYINWRLDLLFGEHNFLSVWTSTWAWPPPPVYMRPLEPDPPPPCGRHKWWPLIWHAYSPSPVYLCKILWPNSDQKTFKIKVAWDHPIGNGIFQLMRPPQLTARSKLSANKWTNNARHVLCFLVY